MKRIVFIAIFALAALPAAAQEDSMAYFRALLQYSEPSAADFGGMVAPEILSVEHYPAYPQPGDTVTVRVKAASYSSMVPYKITKVTLSYRKSGLEWETKVMNLEDKEQGVYSLPLGVVREGDEFTYVARALDDWGNAAVELSPDFPMQVLMKDDEDALLQPPLDIRELSGAYDGARLKLCMQQGGDLKKNIGGEVSIFGIAVFGYDVRYEPDETEGEMGAARVAAYIPAFNIKDLMRIEEILDAATGKKGAKTAGFSSEASRFCFDFRPETIRDDYEVGLKLVGIAVTGELSTMKMKPKDTTRVVMVYPGDHSFKVYKIK